MLLCPTSESPPKRHSAICSLVTNPLDNHAVHMSLPDLIFDLVFVAKILGWYWKIRLGSMQNHTHPVCSDRFVSPIIIVIIYICGCISYVCSLCCQLSRRISLYIYIGTRKTYQTRTTSMNLSHPCQCVFLFFQSDFHHFSHQATEKNSMTAMHMHLPGWTSTPMTLATDVLVSILIVLDHTSLRVQCKHFEISAHGESFYL